ncbi:putative Peptidase C39, bacteriocin processing [Deinococcus deserti VCD115]|uniref:Putative Peptidase C39, bacteriocin processing n=2 Tax=Deinococcus TaxID=1298 RepID=C1CUH1_DEIDV|nr:putative Peptidase C39, bacteriocin processing [Deinococcus deserti VCD115]
MRVFVLLIFLILGTAHAAAPVPGYVLSGMSLVRQTYNACGPASITQVLAYFGLKMNMADVSRRTRPSETSYMTAEAIVRFAPQVGMEARLFTNGSLSIVKSAIKSGLPIIALQSHITDAGKVIPHWRVVVGYNDPTGQVYLMDPLLGYVSMGYADFARVWADQRGQFAVLYPPQLAATVRKVVG